VVATIQSRKVLTVCLAQRENLTMRGLRAACRRNLPAPGASWHAILG